MFEKLREPKYIIVALIIISILVSLIITINVELNTTYVGDDDYHKSETKYIPNPYLFFL